MNYFGGVAGCVTSNSWLDFGGERDHEFSRCVYRNY